MTTAWLSPETVEAAFPGLTKQKLQYLRDEGRGPRYFKPSGRSIFYRPDDIAAWIESAPVATRDQR